MLPNLLFSWVLAASFAKKVQQQKHGGRCPKSAKTSEQQKTLHGGEGGHQGRQGLQGLQQQISWTWIGYIGVWQTEAEERQL